MTTARKLLLAAAAAAALAAIPAAAQDYSAGDADYAAEYAAGGAGAPEGAFAPEVSARTVSVSGGKAEIEFSVDLRDPGLHLDAEHGVSVDGGEKLRADGMLWRVPAGGILKVEINACSDTVCKNAEVALAWNAEKKGFSAAAGADAAKAAPAEETAGTARVSLPEPLCKAEGKMDSKEFKAFLKAALRKAEGKKDSGEKEETDYSWSWFEKLRRAFWRAFLELKAFLVETGYSWLAILLMAFFGGMLMNFSPCVLPMMPVNLAIIGAGARAIDKGKASRAGGAARGAAYGLGIVAAYGTLGLCAALGGMAFGEIQSSPWFNLAIAVLFAALGLSLLDVFFIDFAKFASGGGGKKASFASAFAAGALSAVLAGACVAPVLIFILTYTAKEVAAGNTLATGLPFVFALGMAAPWPVAGAGMKFLPKPGNWMNAVKKVFAVFVLYFAARYGRLAYLGWAGETAEGSVTPEEFPAAYAKAAAEAAEKAEKKGKPVLVLVDCWATWCKNCSWMERNVFQDPGMAETLDRFVVVKLQAEKIGELRRLPGFEDVGGLPAFRIFPAAKKGAGGE